MYRFDTGTSTGYLVGVLLLVGFSTGLTLQTSRSRNVSVPPCALTRCVPSSRDDAGRRTRGSSRGSHRCPQHVPLRRRRHWTGSRVVRTEHANTHRPRLHIPTFGCPTSQDPLGGSCFRPRRRSEQRSRVRDPLGRSLGIHSRVPHVSAPHRGVGPRRSVCQGDTFVFNISTSRWARR